mmetsp:Transcript_22/g.73  ORF Transcript_22/g.73 Transcript_22/m.73 type:complete len:669 (-) Transcript_22:270-2276(-)
MLALSIVELLLLAAGTGLLLWFYKAPEVPAAVAGLIFVCWYLAFSGTLLLPMDLACASGYDDVKEKSSAPCSEPIREAWLWVYWSTFMLTWVVLPIALEYLRSGEFTHWRRLRYALRVNAISYGVALVLGVVLVVYLLASGLGFKYLVGYLLAFGNTYGLLIIIFLMGNGLVELPRTFWQYSEPETYLRVLRYRATCVDNDLYDARVGLETVVADARAAARDVDRMFRESPSAAASLKNHMRVLIIEIQRFLLTLPEEEYGRLRAGVGLSAGNGVGMSVGRGGVSSGRGVGGDAGSPKGEDDAGTENLLASFAQLDQEQGSLRRASWMPASAVAQPKEQTEATLAELNRQFLHVQTRVQVMHNRWQVLVSHVRWVEEVAKYRMPTTNPNITRGGSPGDDELVGKHPTCCRINTKELVRLWSVYVHKWFFLAAAALTAGLSALVFWSEALAASPLRLSPFGAMLDGASNSRIGGADEDTQGGRASDPASGPSAGVQLLALIPLFYMSLATYRSLFKFKMVDLFHLQPRGSASTALIFNATYLIRLQFPLCYNFLLLLRYEDASYTGFKTYLMNRMDMVPVFGTSFNVYGGIILVLIACLTLFRVHARILDAMGLEHEELAIIGDEEEDDRIEEGRALLRRAHRERRRLRPQLGGEEQKESTSATARLLR